MLDWMIMLGEDWWKIMTIRHLKSFRTDWTWFHGAWTILWTTGNWLQIWFFKNAFNVTIFLLQWNQFWGMRNHNDLRWWQAQIGNWYFKSGGFADPPPNIMIRLISASVLHQRLLGRSDFNTTCTVKFAKYAADLFTETNFFVSRLKRFESA